jgi:hypothetical protein
LRLVKQIPPTAADFLSYAQLYPRRDFGRRKCKSAGVSVYKDFEDVVRCRNRTSGLRHHKIAHIELASEHGLLKHTPEPTFPDSHHTWWIPSDVNACILAISEVEEDT